jgi:hypothetical protein
LDHTRLHNSFIFAAPYDLEGAASEEARADLQFPVLSPQLHSSSSRNAERGLPVSSCIRIEKEFHVAFYTSPLNLLPYASLAVGKRGLSASRRRFWKSVCGLFCSLVSYYTAIEQDVRT